MAADDRIAGVQALFAPTNKNSGSKPGDTSQGVISPYLDELQLSMDDKELVQLAGDWEGAWLKAKTDLDYKQKETEKYWLGMNYGDVVDTDKKKPKADNLIFEALETFLPKATQKSPEPVVSSDNTPIGNKIASAVEKMLAYLADNKDVNVRMTLRQVARFHQLYFIGCVWIGWSEKTQNVTCEAVRPQQLILDPDSTIQNGKYTGKFIGRYRKDTGSDLITRFPDKEKDIRVICDDKLGTKLQYIEWWSAGEEPAVFWTIKSLLLGKMKNPHFNYPTTEVQVDEFGFENEVEVMPKNHFTSPQLPCAFLSVMNLGNRPFDETNGLYQCLSMQDVVSKRWKQIDRNADNTNNGIIASLDYFEEGQAAQAAEALRNGDVMLQPHGLAGEGIKRDTGTALPDFIYQNLLDARQRILSVYGVSGSVPSNLQKDKTVRGKIITQSADSDRIGGGFTEYLEQVADQIFNQFVQFMYVYYDEAKMGSCIGKERAREYFTLEKSELAQVDLNVSVREGSLIPKDSLTRRNEAIDLWSANGIDPISFYEALDFPSPRETARMLYLWQQNPAALFPELGMQAPATMQGAPLPSAAPAPSDASATDPLAAVPTNPLPS